MRHLALYRFIRPKATIAEVQAVLHTLEPNAMIYSPSQVFRGEDSLGLSRVAGSTTADNAYLPINIQKRHMYWNNPYPLGMIGTATEDIIDIDECGLFLESSNRGVEGVIKRGYIIG